MFFGASLFSSKLSITISPVYQEMLITTKTTFSEEKIYIGRVPKKRPLRIFRKDIQLILELKISLG